MKQICNDRKLLWLYEGMPLSGFCVASQSGTLQHLEVSHSPSIEFGRGQGRGAMAEPLLAGTQGQPVGFQIRLPVPARFPGLALSPSPWL